MKLSKSTLWPVLLMLLYACSNNNHHIPTITLPSPDNFSEEINVSRFILIGPFTGDTSEKHRIDTNDLARYGIKEEDLSNDNFRSLKNEVYQSKGYYADLSALFGPLQGANCYVLFSIKSPVEQDVAFLLGSDDGVKIWVNKTLRFRVDDARSLQRNTNIVAVHLKKGDNTVVVKSNNLTRGWAFYLNISSVKYASEFYQHLFASDLLESCLINTKDTLKIRVNPHFTTMGDSAAVHIFSNNEQKVFTTKVPADTFWKIPVDSMLSGAYKCQVLTKTDTISEIFVVGNYNALFNKDSATLAAVKGDQDFRINTRTLLSRFRFLEDFGIRNKFDNLLYRKIAITLYEIESIINDRGKPNLFADKKGWHLRGYLSPIDSSIENYMVYLPPSYQKGQPIPLVVVMPWVYRKMPYAEGPHVAYLGKIETMMQLADKFGYAVLWSSSRIHEQYNLNPIVSASTFAAIRKVSQDYSINKNRVYLYGICTGGLFSLQIANRYPSLFAAVGVEGPELSYTTCETESGQHNYSFCPPKDWVKENNILKSANNFRNVSIYLSHAPGDQKADYNISRRLFDLAKRAGADIVLDSVPLVVKTPSLDLYPEEIIQHNIFSFFKGKEITPPAVINFSTFQLKYNQAYWITINRLDTLHRQANIKAVYTDNVVQVSTKNIAGYTVDIAGMPKVAPGKKLLITTNNDTSYFNFPDATKTIVITVPGKKVFNLREKTSSTEGPVNDLFKESFVVVRGTTGSKSENAVNDSLVDKFVKNWRENNFADCPVKRDVAVTPYDIAHHNLILIGNPGTNAMIKRLLTPTLPVKILKDSMVIGQQKIAGAHLEYTLIYPNPLNAQKYILLLGSNDPLSREIDLDLQETGWYDYEIKDGVNGTVLAKGYFDKFWNQLPFTGN